MRVCLPYGGDKEFERPVDGHGKLVITNTSRRLENDKIDDSC